MSRMGAVFNRVLKELVRDKRTLALMLLAPMLILALMNVVFDVSDDVHVKIGIDDSVPNSLVEAFPSDSVKIHTYQTDNVKQTISHNNLDAFITLDKNTFHVTYENEDPSNTAKVKALFTSVLTSSKVKTLVTDLQQAAKQTHQAYALTDYTVKNAYVYGDANSTFFDKILPILIGFFIFFFVFLISGIALLKERTSGTLERLLATPIKRSEIVFGYLGGYGLFAILQTLLIVFFSIYILNLTIVGNLFWVLVITILLALVALSMGIFISTFAGSEFQMIQFIPIVVIPQVFFSGIISLDTMAPWVKGLSYIFPLSYAGGAMTDVMLKGQGFADIWFDLLILCLFILVFTLLNISGLRKYRKV